MFSLLAVALLITLASAQAPPTSAVPHFVEFSGVLHDAEGQPVTEVVGITFALYRDQSGDAPLWIETQNVNPDANGHYTVSLGANRPDGLPLDLFTSGEARWLGVQPAGQKEQPRVLLLSVPYALKAANAETVGGLPASAFMLATPSNFAPSASAPQASGVGSAPVVSPGGVNPDAGTKNFIPLFTDNSGTLGNSTMFQSGTGNSAKLGIGTTNPSTTLDVKGPATVRGNLALVPTGTANANSGKNSQPVSQAASVFNSITQTAVTQTFRWQAEPVGNNTNTPSGSLNLLFASGSAPLAETGLNIASNGRINFALGQTFPGTGTITGVTAGTDLTGGGTSGNVTLNVDTTKVPQLNGNNSFTGNETISGNISAGGTVSASAVSASAVSGQAVATFSGSTDTILILTQNGSGDGIDIYNSGSTGIAVVSSGASSGGISVFNSSGVPALYAENETTFSSDNLVFETYSQSFLGECAIDVAGNFGCTGTKSAVVPVSGARKVALYAVEAPENWFEDFGSDRLSGGVATILLEPTFAETVNTDMEYHVFLTPKGDCKGLFVSNERASSFEVHEMGSGTSNVAFDYRIVAKRKAYESIRLADMTKKFQKPNVPRPKAAR